MGSDVAELRRRILAELRRRRTSARDASLAAGLGSSTLNAFLRGEKGLGPKAARKLAASFGWSEDEVLALAGHRSPRPDGDPLAVIRDALTTGRWGAARGPLLALIALTDAERQHARWARAWQVAVEEVLEAPIAAGGGAWTAEDVLALVQHEFRERLLAELAKEDRT